MKYFLCTVLLFMFVGCGNPDVDSKTDSAAKADSTALIDSIARIPVDSVTPDTIAKVIDTVAAEPKVRGLFRVLYTSNSCGGARPTQEIVEQYGTPTLLTSSTLKFKNHYSGKEYFLKTSPDGEAAADMEEGKYDVFFTKEINPNLPHTGFDPKCTLWTNQLLLTVKVTANGKLQDVNVHFVCNPCDDQSKMRQ